MSEIMDAFWAAPPVARSISAAVLVASLGRLLGLVPVDWFYWEPYFLTLMPPQIWRLVTNFLFSTPKLGVVLDPYYLFSYTKQLETMNPKFSKKEDVVWYLVVVSSIILALNTVFGLDAPLCLQALIVSVTYTVTQDQRGQQASFFFFTIPAQLVPYAMIFSSLVMGAQPNQVLLQVVGLLAAHLHDFLFRLWPEFGGGRNWLATPAFMSRLVPATARVEQRSFGTAFAARTAGSSAGSGPLPDAWKTRGAGHRLG